MFTKAWMATKTTLRIFIFLSVLILAQASSDPPLADSTERVRFYTRSIEFDYLAWLLNAVGVKFDQTAIGLAGYLDDDARAGQMLDFIQMTREIQIAEGQLRSILSDPAIEDKDAAARDVRARLDELYASREVLGPLAESILQSQVVSVLDDLGLDLAGQSLPPVLYHMTPAPLGLVVSPRDVIRQDDNISLQPALTLDEQIALEEAVAQNLDVSTLVVGIGGVGVYPTMVTQTSDINWLAEVVAHEWIHNYFTLRPLGVSYLNSPELRKMNELSATIGGKEIGRLVIEKFYPEFAPPPPEPVQQSESPQPTPEPPDQPVFNFRAEMRETRLTVDDLLLAGKIDEAEAYMEARRIFLWENGYRIRKINQAYFAWFGAYEDVPGGLAGDDPVGDAIRELRARSDSLQDFLNTISWMSSFEQLQAYLAQN